MLDYIRRYVDLGFVVHPLCPPTHRCQSPGKIPYVPGEGHMPGWQDHEQFTLEQWQEWLDYDSEINVGFLCGRPSGLICLDIDNDEGMKYLEQSDIPWRDTWQYRTGRGLRVLFRNRGVSPSRVISTPDYSIEILGDGRQSVLPPSVHPNGRRYEWVVEHTPRDRECSGELKWLNDIGTGRDGLDGLNSDDNGTDWGSVLKSPPRTGERNTRLASIAGRLLSPGGLSDQECKFWLSLYNEHFLPERISSRELSSIVRSIGQKEERVRVSGERDIKRIMIDRCVSYDDAKMIWQNMED